MQGRTQIVGMVSWQYRLVIAQVMEYCACPFHPLKIIFAFNIKIKPISRFYL